MRIKCPKCGSTSQIEMTWNDGDNYGVYTTKEYTCGCGCCFEVEFKAISTKILGEE